MCLHASITKYPPKQFIALHSLDTVAINVQSLGRVLNPFLLLQSHDRKVRLLFLSKAGVSVGMVSYWNLGLTMAFGLWFCGHFVKPLLLMSEILMGHC